MSKNGFLAALVATWVMVPWVQPVMAQEHPGKPADVEAPRQVVTTSVDAADYERRTLTFKGQGDAVVTARASKQVKHLNQFKKGDKVVVEYLESVAVVARRPDGKSLPGYQGDVEVHPRGTTDEGLPVETTEFLGTVVSVDGDHRTLTVKHPDGTTKTLPVADMVKRLRDLYKGDTVDIRYTEPLLLQVEPLQDKK